MRSGFAAQSLSTNLVEYLRKQGRTLKEIGAMVDLSESFVSRVARGERSFTMEHLDRFEAALGEPLPALIMEATWRNQLPDEKQPEFERVLAMLKELGSLRLALPAGMAAAAGDTRPAGKPRARKRKAS